MNRALSKLPDHERAYRALRDMILNGELAPGQPVTIQGLVDLLGLGMTPVREAIRRLTSEGALEFKGNRRVSVPNMDAATYGELAFARLAVEPELARRAVPNLDAGRIAALESLDAKVDDAIAQGDVRGYLESNRHFHVRLYELANAPVLMSISNMLWLRTGPSLRVMLGRAGTANLPDQHQEALAAMRAGDADAVALAIRADIEQGIRQVQSSLAAVGA
ncbi:GntR family transcriptional regulator [Maritimibacter sp. DP1N21-5]|uniref:GntR family transcriptional regulator n=1 Tax=Maritimibacter sp. DP1N21-5 TaxID=2836867 RepID=UPI001C473BC4|nr:GntR family transcriptional regulator [Maritimibacter sp. DP1N21-5]MBV7410578.1 GntR family transcriptional regulator [Maritimibacter sp. DP1N21-5]